MARSRYTVMLINSQKGLELVSSPQNLPKNVRNVYHKEHSYLTKFHFDSIWNSKHLDILSMKHFFFK